MPRSRRRFHRVPWFRRWKLPTARLEPWVAPVIWLDERVQLGVDTTVHAVMNAFEVRKSVVKYTLGVAMICLLILEAVFHHRWIAILDGLFWLWIIHSNDRVDNVSEVLSVESSMDALSRTLIALSKVLSVWWFAKYVVRSELIGMARESVLLTMMYLLRTPPDPPPPRVKRELVPARARA